jgi:cyclopropane fatty-acyl-phospholipid synthase-like methyltransferase
MESENLKQYDKLSKEYASLAEVDPSKRFLQYPEALRLLGDLEGKQILDIGCGNGTFTRMMARRGADVVGYDPSEGMVNEAIQEEKEENLGIKYFVADKPAVTQETKFDKAVSVMVLLYAQSPDKLNEIFADAYKSLNDGGSFTSITFNPDYQRLGQVAYNRRFNREGDGKMAVEFIDQSGNTTFKAGFNDFSKEQIENAAQQAGFKEFHWEILHPNKEGQEQMPEFWQGMETDPPYIGFIATK